MFVLMISFYVAFLLKIANTFKEYTYSIYFTSSISIITFSFMVFVFKMKKIFELIDRSEIYIEKSNCIQWKEIHFAGVMKIYLYIF